MNGYEITLILFAACALAAIPVIVAIDKRREKRRLKRTFDNMQYGDVYIDKDDDEDPFATEKTYAVVLDRRTNSNGVRYVCYKNLRVWDNGANGKQCTSGQKMSMRLGSFLYEYRKTDLKYDGTDIIG